MIAHPAPGVRMPFAPELLEVRGAILWAAGFYEEEVESVVWTSGFRDGDPGAHGRGLALDADMVWKPGVHEQRQIQILKDIAALAQAVAGMHFDILAHDSGFGWHIHSEYDPKSLDHPPGPGQLARVKRAAEILQEAA